MSDLDLRDRMGGFGRSLFDAADVDAPAAGSRDALLASLGLGVVVTAAATATATAAATATPVATNAATTTASALGAKGIVLGLTKALVVAAVATGGAVAIHHTLKPTTPKATPTTVTTVAKSEGMSAKTSTPPAPIAPSTPAPTVSPAELADVPAPDGAKAKASTSRTTRTAKPTPDPASPGLAEQVRLVDEARTALRQGDTASALEATRRFEQRFGVASALSPETMLVAVQAHLARGDRASARAVLAKLEAHHPSSAATRRAKEIVGLED